MNTRTLPAKPTGHGAARLTLDVALARKLAIILTIKICFIVGIKQVWFSHPQTENMTLPTQAVEARLLGTPAP